MAVFLDDKACIGQLIWKTLKKQKKTQKWLCEKVGCTQTYMGKVCNGETKNISIQNAMKISESLNIPIEDLWKALEQDSGV